MYTEVLKYFEPVNINGAIFWKVKGFGEEEDFQLVEEQFESQERSYISIVRDFINRKMYTQALEYIRRAKEEGFETCELMKYEVIALMYFGDVEGARKVLQETKELFPYCEGLSALERVVE